jgi:hypothetical protein
MSTCISRHGEYSAHTVGDDFYCEFCGAFDEQAAVDEAYKRGRAEQAAADRARIEAVLAEPDDVQWWPVTPYMDPSDDDEVVEVQVVTVDRLRAALDSDAPIQPPETQQWVTPDGRTLVVHYDDRGCTTVTREALTELLVTAGLRPREGGGKS